MTGRTIKSHDPDLDQTIIDMASTCHRLAIAEFAVAEAYKQEEAGKGSGPVARCVAHLNAIQDTLKARADVLNIKPANGLRVIIAQHERLRVKMGRRPTMDQLMQAVEAIEWTYVEDAKAEEAAACAADFKARRARSKAKAGASAAAYLRACA